MITNLRAKKNDKNARPSLQTKYTQKSQNDQNLIQRKSSMKASLSKNLLYAEEFIIAESPIKVSPNFFCYAVVILNSSIHIELKPKNYKR